MTTVNVGDVLATKYRVEKILGIGGMGMVVAATHLELDQRVALKFMLPDAMRSDQAMDRFLREAKAAVKLRSEHVCRVLDVGRLETGAPYIVMEYMEGQDFADTIQQRGRLSASDAVDYVMQALEGLAEAHVNNIVHRDLKPGNLFVTSDNEGLPLVKVLDFGISKSSVAGSATRTGEIMGSPSYMSPEQMTSSKNVDARADIWAMGVILYQALTASLPFDGDTLPALCMSVMTNQPPPIAVHRPDVPPGLAAAIMRCMEKNPDARYRDVAELAAAIAPFGSESAPASAVRVARVLRRSGASPAASNSGMPATIVASGAHALTPAPGARVTTLQGSAGAVVTTAAPTSPSPTKLAFFGIGAAAIAGVVVVMIFGGSRGSSGDGAPSVTPSSQPEVASEPATPTPTPTPTHPPTPPAAAPVPAPAPTTAPTTAPAPQQVVAAPVVAPVKTETTTKPTHRTTHTTTKTAEKAATKVETTKPAAPVPAPTESKPLAPATETKPAQSKWTRMQHDKSN